MPVVELDYSRLQKLVGGKTNRKKILETLPYLGLDIESIEKEKIRVEYSPNRPDYSTDFGIALGLQGLLGIKKGLIPLKIKKKSYSLQVDSSVSKIRPYITAIVAKNGKIDVHIIRQLMVMQEDLHFGIGRRRKKSSIGIHDLDKLSFPLNYTSIDRNHKFIPLGSKNESTIEEILKNSEVGKAYSNILSNFKKVPIILDSTGNTVSFPPIINSEYSTVIKKTKNLFVEVTGINKNYVEDVLAVVVLILQSAGFELYQVKINGAKNSTPKLATKKITLEENLVKNMLGLKLSPREISTAIQKCRLDAEIKNKKIVCNIPRYRFDIFGPMDLIEEVALGYGIENLKPNMSPPQTLGNKSLILEKLNSISLVLVGLGFLEVLNSCLTSKRILDSSTNRDSSHFVSVMDSKSREHTILRDLIIPGLIENLSKNIHEPYPQKLFEIGTVFTRKKSIDEEIHLAVVSSHKDANFSEIKSILQSTMKMGFSKNFQTKATSNQIFEEGRTAKIEIEHQPRGIIGFINSNLVQDFKIREPAVGFEINLSGLIFDSKEK